MSGATDLARLTETIDTANELLLSDQIKMMDVGDGVMRPTNAKVLADLSSQMTGAIVYTSSALGLAGTVSGGHFSVVSPESDEYLILYRNDAGTSTEVDRYPNATGTKKASETAQAAYELSPSRALSPDIPWAVVDEFLRVILGVRADGVVSAILDKLPGLDLIGDYAWAITDVNGVVLLGIKWSGELVTFGQATTTPTAYVSGPNGAQDIWMLVGGEPYQLTSSGDNYNPTVASGQVFFIKRDGPVQQVTLSAPEVGQLASFVLEVLHIIGSGQSLCMGSTSPATTFQPPAANRLLTIQDGVRLTVDTDVLASEMVAPFKPMIAKNWETPAVQLTAQINRLRGLPARAASLTSVHGRGGVGITNLWKGTQPYANAITAVTAAKAECDRLGYGYRVPFIDWIHGENDRNSAAGLYTSRLMQMQADYETDIKAITGQAQGVPLLLDQISNWTAYGDTESLVPFEQLQVALDNPSRFLCAGPKYWAQSSPDGIHLPSQNSMRLGAQHARAAQAIIDGHSWLPTHCVSAVRSGATVTLKFHVPNGPLVIDTVNVIDPGNWGIRWVDDSLSATVSAVRLVGNDTVIVTLSSVPTGTNQKIGIADIGTPNAAAGPATGPRACLRDSNPDLDAYGQPVFNWACHQRVPVTTI